MSYVVCLCNSTGYIPIISYFFSYVLHKATNRIGRAHNLVGIPGRQDNSSVLIISLLAFLLLKPKWLTIIVKKKYYIFSIFIKCTGYIAPIN